MGPSRSHAPGLCRQNAAASNLLPNISCSSKNLTALHCPGSAEETRKIWGPVTMFSEELWLENEKCAVVRKPKPGRKRQELLAVALGVKVGVKGAFLWPPLKLFACPQISSLVRRAALTHNDNHFNYEKTHNFKVSEPLHAFFCYKRAGGELQAMVSVWALVKSRDGRFSVFHIELLALNQIKRQVSESSLLDANIQKHLSVC